MKWWIEDEKVRFKYVAEKDQPYHVTVDGEVEGHSKKLKTSKKGVKFTCCKVLQSENRANDTLLIGDSSGSLHVYECQYLTKIVTFQKHIAPILAITVNHAE